MWKFANVFALQVAIGIAYLTAYPGNLRAQSTDRVAPQVAAVASWSGAYWGTVSGQVLRAVFEEVEGGVQGEMRDPTGYLYQILAQTAAGAGVGVLLDPRTGAQMMVELQLSGDSMAVVIQSMPGGSAQAPPIEVLLFRGEVPAEALGPASMGSPGSAQAPGAPGAGDGRLVGTWRYSQSYTSGDFSMVTSYNFVLLPDGHFSYGSGGVQGGGDAGSLGSQGGITNQGRWRTENDVLLLNEGAGWQPYARFVVDAQQMMLIFGDDSRQLWQRIAY